MSRDVTRLKCSWLHCVISISSLGYHHSSIMIPAQAFEASLSYHRPTQAESNDRHRKTANQLSMYASPSPGIEWHCDYANPDCAMCDFNRPGLPATWACQAVKAWLMYTHSLEIGNSFRLLSAAGLSLTLDHCLIDAYITIWRSANEGFKHCSNGSGYFHHRTTHSAAIRLHTLNTAVESG